MNFQFEPRPFGATGINVSPLGLSTSYLPGKKAVYAAVEEGINLFFAFGFDVQMKRALRDILPSHREQYVLATGAYNYVWWGQDVRKALEKRLRQFKTEYVDLFLFLGVMKPAEYSERIREDMARLKEEGKVRAIGISCHNRPFLGELAQGRKLDAMMMRYNAAHRGAERDIFPHLKAHNPGVLSYTATRWTYLLRRPKGWPKDGRVPTAGECYRFVLSNPNVHVALTAPRNERELQENVAAVRKGPLGEDDMKFMKEFGDAVYNRKQWFM